MLSNSKLLILCMCVYDICVYIYVCTCMCTRVYVHVCISTFCGCFMYWCRPSISIVLLSAPFPKFMFLYLLMYCNINNFSALIVWK